MRVSENARNVLIVLALAAVVYAVPGGGKGLGFVGSVLSILITASFAFLGYRLYRENRVDIFSLGDRYRGLLYGAIGAIVFLFAARQRLWEDGAGGGDAAGLLLWFALFGAAVYSIVLVYRRWRSFQY